MLQKLLTNVNDFSGRVGLLNAIVSSVAVRLLSDDTAQACKYTCGALCQITQLCPTNGEYTLWGSTNVYCVEPLCFFPQGYCC